MPTPTAPQSRQRYGSLPTTYRKIAKRLRKVIISHGFPAEIAILPAEVRSLPPVPRRFYVITAAPEHLVVQLEREVAQEFARGAWLLPVHGVAP